ncbi:MAG TPA: BamA/TamA family outer membrane protein [Polyangiaceae bacterium]
MALLLVVPARAADPPGEGAVKEETTEFTPAPIIGGNSDLGIGGGVIGSFARMKPGFEPYVYRFELTSMTMLKGERGTLKVPYQDDYLLFSMPNLFGRRMKLEFRAAYTRETTLKYYGIGNASKVPASRSLDDPLYEYERTHPELTAKSRILLVGKLFVILGLGYTHNWLHVRSDTLLATDARAGSPVVRDMVTAFAPHGVMTFSYGVELDTRNEEVSPARGQYLATRVDLSPGGTDGVPQRWGRSDTSLRWFVPVGQDGSTVAARIVGDLTFGDPPIYELSRFDDTGAIGGPNGVRGVPGQRYHGQIQVFGNLEFRKMLFHFRFLGKDNGFEMATFIDAGRVWATYASHPELDGTSLGLKLGIGGGPRLVAGKSFVLRGDVAWSPDARPIGAYLTAGHAF